MQTLQIMLQHISPSHILGLDVPAHQPLMSDDNTLVHTAQVNAIMGQLRPQLPVVAAGGVIADELIKNVQEILVRNHEAIISGALIAGGLAVLLPALTIAIVNVVGFTAGGVAAGV